MVATHHLTGPTPNPLPPVETDFWKESTWTVLFAILDAATPPVVVESSLTDKHNQFKISQKQYEEAYEHVRWSMTDPPELDKFKEYLRARPSDDPRFVQNVKRVLSNLSFDDRKRLAGSLDLMG